MNRLVRRSKKPLLILISLAAIGLFVFVACQSEVSEPEQRGMIKIIMFEGPETNGLIKVIPEWEHLRKATAIEIIFKPPGEEVAPRIQAMCNDVIKGTVNWADVEAMDPLECPMEGKKDGLLESMVNFVESGQSGLDVILLDDPWVPFFAGGHHLTDLSEEFGYKAEADFVQQSVRLGMWPPPFGPMPPDSDGRPRGDGTFAIPLVGNVMMLWYRMDHFAGQSEVPELPKNLDDMLSVFDGVGNQSEPLFGMVPTLNIHAFITWLYARGGKIFNGDWDVVLGDDISTDAFAEFLKQITRLFDTESDSGDNPSSGDLMLKGTGSAAVWWVSQANEINSSGMGDLLDVIELPEGERQTSLVGN